MTHRPILLEDISLSFPHKTCFEDFNAQIYPGQSIGIIGPNGSGKSTLLRMIAEFCAGRPDIVLGHVPQIIEDLDALSGSQRFQCALSQALSQQPNILLLDEPTNHLDIKNRKALMRMLRGFQGTLLVVSHDPELLRTCIDTLWHLDTGRIKIYSDSYDDFTENLRLKRETIESKLAGLKAQKRETHERLMKEQERAQKSRQKGEKSIRERKWPTVKSPAKVSRANETFGNKKKALRNEREDLIGQLSELRIPESIVPKFSIESGDINPSETVIFVSDGACGYDRPILTSINFQLKATERVAIMGDNGSGKTTFVRAILQGSQVRRTGVWRSLPSESIGYLDQHYQNLRPDWNALEHIQACRPQWTHAEIRRFLNDFLFRKNEEVNLPLRLLSGGERARLSLAQIAAKTPRLLILDELTNNLDLETRNHVTGVLREYPGALLVISHDDDFRKSLGELREFFI